MAKDRQNVSCFDIDNQIYTHIQYVIYVFKNIEILVSAAV